MNETQRLRNEAIRSYRLPLNTMSTNLEHKRHTLAHVLAATVLEQYPHAKVTLGPAIDTGFYYDFDFSAGDAPGEEDLKGLQKSMKKLVNKWTEWTVEEVTAEQAREVFAGNEFKLELIDEIEAKGEAITLYTCGGFTDLCRGGHAENPSQDIDMAGMKLDKIAGAYWRGSEKNPMLTRIYGLAFDSKEDLVQYEHDREEARKRDHRKLGKELDIFMIDQEVGLGLPLYLPTGATIRQTLERYCYQEAKKAGYQYVYTPHIGKSDLFAKSGHLDHYADGMFSPIDMKNLHGEGADQDGKVEQFYLKPMNCPMHHYIYLNRPRSYRELPYRLYEYGTVYRYEDSGTLSGMIRVRGFTQNDAHVYCRTTQLKDVIGEAVTRFQAAYKACGITDYAIRFSLPDFENDAEKFGEETQEWIDSVAAMRTALDELGIDYYDAPGEAAFYGPKIDFQVKNVNGKEDSLSTIQVDYSIAPKFGITYTNEDGEDEVPAIIHMALMGSIDRFMAFMIEMTGGRLPLWLAPTQVKILTINNEAETLAYVQEVTALLDETVLMQPLRYNEIRYTIDDRQESLNKKIREAEKQKTPLMFIVGPKDIEAKTVSVRQHNEETTVALNELQNYIQSL